MMKIIICVIAVIVYESCTKSYEIYNPKKIKHLIPGIVTSTAQCGPATKTLYHPPYGPLIWGGDFFYSNGGYLYAVLPEFSTPIIISKINKIDK